METFCDVCKKTVFNRSKGHRYSTQHKILLKKMLEKFMQKVSLVSLFFILGDIQVGCLQVFFAQVTAAKACLKYPSVQKFDEDNDATFWCPVCAKEFKRNLTLDKCYVDSGGLLVHFTR